MLYATDRINASAFWISLQIQRTKPLQLHILQDLEKKKAFF